MLTRFVRTQLILFTIASLVGVAVMLFGYMQLPTLLGLGRTVVKLELPATGGLYKFSNVTYRGVQVGKVTGVDLTPTGAVATLSLDSSPKIPAALTAHVRSMSAVGEQYVDLQPSTDEGPYLASGSVIPREATTIPQAVGPMLDQVSALVDTIPKEQLSKLLDETYKAFYGTGYDFGSMLDSASTISREGDRIADRTRRIQSGYLHLYILMAVIALLAMLIFAAVTPTPAANGQAEKPETAPAAVPIAVPTPNLMPVPAPAAPALPLPTVPGPRRD